MKKILFLTPTRVKTQTLERGSASGEVPRFPRAMRAAINRQKN